MVNLELNTVINVFIYNVYIDEVIRQKKFKEQRGLHT